MSAVFEAIAERSSIRGYTEGFHIYRKDKQVIYL